MSRAGYRAVLRRFLLVSQIAFVAFGAVVAARAAETKATQAPQATCVVPTQQPTIQSAVNQGTCTTILVNAGVFRETVTIHRSLTLTGAGVDLTTITGRVEVSGAGVVVLISDLAVDTTGPLSAGCFDHAIQILDGAEALVIRSRGINIAPGSRSCLFYPIFVDGFETGNTSRWSAAVGALTARTPPAAAASATAAKR